MTGALNAAAQVSGTLGNPSGGAHLTIDNGTAYGEAFDHANAAVTFADQLVKLDPVKITKGAAQLSASGSQVHPGDAFDSGHPRSRFYQTQFNSRSSKRLGATPGFQRDSTPSANVAVNIIKQAASSSSHSVRSIEANLSANGRAIKPLLTAT